MSETSFHLMMVPLYAIGMFLLGCTIPDSKKGRIVWCLCLFVISGWGYLIFKFK